jgi:vacuolar-type H+-ATPase subunit I/STV1
MVWLIYLIGSVFLAVSFGFTFGLKFGFMAFGALLIIGAVTCKKWDGE